MWPVSFGSRAEAWIAGKVGVMPHKLYEKVAALAVEQAAITTACTQAVTHKTTRKHMYSQTNLKLHSTTHKQHVIIKDKQMKARPTLS